MDRNNKNNYGNENAVKSEEIIKQIQYTLHKKYGYCPNRIRYKVPLGSDPQKINNIFLKHNGHRPTTLDAYFSGSDS
jgi:hypothetical protein